MIDRIKLIFSKCWIDKINRIKWIDLLDPIDPINPINPTLRKFPLDLCEPKFKKKLLYHLLKTVISNIQYQRSCSVVVITSTSNAGGPWFKPR